MEYTTKLTLHVPRYAWENGLIPVAYGAFKERLLNALEAAGATSLYTQEATGYYKGREYGEVLWTVFCEEQDRGSIVEAFRETFKSENTYMKQEAFSYEANGVLTVEEL